MQNYYRMVAVQAQPMTKGEAYSNGILNSINNDKKDAEGYVIIDVDGERSWMPKDKFKNTYVDSIDKISDGYHTFGELYRYRMLYNAALFNTFAANETVPVYKSYKHSDGEDCFGGKWFIVVANLPTGQISNHYENRYWDLFKVPELSRAPEYDGHTPAEAADRLESYLKKDSTFIKRLIDELRGLDSKLGKLNTFIGSGKIHKVISDPYQKAMLCLQREVMNAYSNILNCRIGRLEAAPEAPLHNMTFGLAVELLKMGHVLRRSGWNGKNLYVCKQVPALIEEDVIPKMQSLPEQMKDVIINGKGFISYESQCLIYNGNTGRADSWVPSISDIFADDWELII